jgi:hypothetical protein
LRKLSTAFHAEGRVLDAEVSGGRDHAVVDTAVAFQSDESDELALDPPARYSRPTATWSAKSMMIAVSRRRAGRSSIRARLAAASP